MLKLKAKYVQVSNFSWTAYVVGYSRIYVDRAEDLETARVILRIVTAEEIGAGSRRRVDWDIVEETIMYYSVNTKYDTSIEDENND